MTNKGKDVIDMGKVLKRLLTKKKYFIKVWVITFLLSCLWILPQPRYYDASAVLAPEMAGEMQSGSLSSIASSFGVNLGSAVNDAIYPLLYPDLISSNDFIVQLMDIPVKSLDGEINCDLYTYLEKKQKVAFYMKPFLALKRWIGKTFGGNDDPVAAANKNAKGKRLDRFMLNRRQTAIVNKLKDNITCSVDKKTEVITITVRAQDALIAAALADSVRTRLQSFIIDYRTSKARVDVQYYDKITAEAKAAYEKVRRTYGSYADANLEVSLPSFQAKQEDIENDMQLKFNTYSAMNTQLQAAKAKLQERTPAFTVLQSPTVPVKPSGPKRMIFVFVMLVMVTFICSVYQARDILFPKKEEE
jgi:uncharacterized protein involved in exopolysaccharide biosynthesis